MTLLKSPISDAELASIVKTYGDKLGDVQYLPFLEDCNILNYIINEDFTGAKSTYTPKYTDFAGSKTVDQLM